MELNREEVLFLNLRIDTSKRRLEKLRTTMKLGFALLGVVDDKELKEEGEKIREIIEHKLEIVNSFKTKLEAEITIFNITPEEISEYKKKELED